MNEENENQSATGRTSGAEPAPLETESAAPEQRHHRPRRRFPRRRYRGDRFRRDNSEESPNSSSANADNADVAVETMDQSAPTASREAAEGGGETSEPVQTEPEFGEGIIEISGKGFGFLRDPKRNFVQTPQDIFVTPEIVRRFGLRDGMWIYGE